MYKSLILPLAKEDIREAALWYNKQQNLLKIAKIQKVAKPQEKNAKNQNYNMR